MPATFRRNSGGRWAPKLPRCGWTATAGMPKGYAFFQARPRDWLRIGLAIRNDGVVDGRQVVPAEWLALMTTPSPTNPKYGLQDMDRVAAHERTLLQPQIRRSASGRRSRFWRMTWCSSTAAEGSASMSFRPPTW